MRGRNERLKFKTGWKRSQTTVSGRVTRKREREGGALPPRRVESGAGSARIGPIDRFTIGRAPDRHRGGRRRSKRGHARARSRIIRRAQVGTYTRTHATAASWVALPDPDNGRGSVQPALHFRRVVIERQNYRDPWWSWMERGWRRRARSKGCSICR